MGKIEVDQIDENTVKGIELRARINGRTFEEEVRAILAQHALPPAKDWGPEIERIRALTPKDVAQTDSVEILRQIRGDRAVGR